MFISNTINIPLAIFTVILRRFIDRLRHSETQLPIACRATSWFCGHPAVRPIIYSYLLIAVVRFVIKRMEKETLVTVASSYTGSLVSLRERTHKPARHSQSFNEKNFFMTRNLKRNKASRHRAMKYVASLSPSRLPLPRHRQCGPKNPRPQHYNYDLSVYTFNPYLEPKSTKPIQHGPLPSGNLSAMSENESCASDEINTILSPKDRLASSISSTTIESFDTYCDKMAHEHKEDVVQPELVTATTSISLINSEATTSPSDVPVRTREKRAIAAHASDAESVPSKSFIRTRSGKIYDQSSIICKPRKR